jgi:hypothetical protein
MIRERGTRERNIPDRFVAKYLLAKSSAWKFWISELIAEGRSGCRPVDMRFVLTASTKIGDEGRSFGSSDPRSIVTLLVGSVTCNCPLTDDPALSAIT